MSTTRKLPTEFVNRATNGAKKIHDKRKLDRNKNQNDEGFGDSRLRDEILGKLGEEGFCFDHGSGEPDYVVVEKPFHGYDENSNLMSIKTCRFGYTHNQNDKNDKSGASFLIEISSITTLLEKPDESRICFMLVNEDLEGEYESCGWCQFQVVKDNWSNWAFQPYNPALANRKRAIYLEDIKSFLHPIEELQGMKLKVTKE